MGYALRGVGLVFCGIGFYLWSAEGFSPEFRHILSMLNIYVGFCAMTRTSLGSLQTMLWANLALSLYAIHHSSPAGSGNFQIFGITAFILSLGGLYLSIKTKEA